MQQEQLLTQRGAATGVRQSSSRPPCCGTGCAVCVLDYWIEDEFELPAQTAAAAVECDHERRDQSRKLVNNHAPSGLISDAPAVSPECCKTGCMVCVLDYPDDVSNQGSESETLAMLEAIEEAQRQARQMAVNQDGSLL